MKFKNEEMSGEALRRSGSGTEDDDDDGCCLAEI